MVQGKRLAIYSAFVTSNVCLDSLKEKQVLSDAEAEILDDASDFAHELNDDDSNPVQKDHFSPIQKDHFSPIDNGNKGVSPQKYKEVTFHHRWKSEVYKDQPGHHGNDRLDEFGHLIRPRYLSNHTHITHTQIPFQGLPHCPER